MKKNKTKDYLIRFSPEMYKDLDEMEALGMYEVSPEDFALTEFICVSKQPHQSIIREGLDLMKKEIG